MWFRNYFVAYACVVCITINNEELFLMLTHLKIHIILVLYGLDAVHSTGKLFSID